MPIVRKAWEATLEKVLRRIFGLSVYARIPPASSAVLTAIILVSFIALYLFVSYDRHIENPSDKLVPGTHQLIGGVERAVTPDRNGEIPLLVDTLASMRRFFLGVFIGSALGILLGVHMGLFPFLEALLFRIVQFFGKIPPLALLPMIFIFAGLGEFAKVLLIVIGIFPPILVSTYFRTKSIPKQQLVKALTLGGSTSEVVMVALTQVMPYALNTVRINLLNAWLFLIFSETIAAEAGLGYRIYLVRRYLAMDTIIPYVIWIALLSILFEVLLVLWISRRYRWYQG